MIDSVPVCASQSWGCEVNKPGSSSCRFSLWTEEQWQHRATGRHAGIFHNGMTGAAGLNSEWNLPVAYLFWSQQQLDGVFSATEANRQMVVWRFIKPNINYWAWQSISFPEGSGSRYQTTLWKMLKTLKNEMRKLAPSYHVTSVKAQQGDRSRFSQEHWAEWGDFNCSFYKWQNRKWLTKPFSGDKGFLSSPMLGNDLWNLAPFTKRMCSLLVPAHILMLPAF